MKTLTLAAIRCFLTFSLPAVAIAPSVYATSTRSIVHGAPAASRLWSGRSMSHREATRSCNGGPSPFTDVNLILTIEGTPFFLDHPDTSLIFGTGQFLINATASFLIFNTANANGLNPADLEFFNSNNTARYVIGSDGNPHFEIGITPLGHDFVADVSFPVVFGTVADQDSTFLLLTLGLVGLMACRRQFGTLNSLKLRVATAYSVSLCSTLAALRQKLSY